MVYAKNNIVVDSTGVYYGHECIVEHDKIFKIFNANDVITVLKHGNESFYTDGFYGYGNYSLVVYETIKDLLETKFCKFVDGDSVGGMVVIRKARAGCNYWYPSQNKFRMIYTDNINNDMPSLFCMYWPESVATEVVPIDLTNGRVEAGVVCSTEFSDVCVMTVCDDSE